MSPRKKKAESKPEIEVIEEPVASLMDCDLRVVSAGPKPPTDIEMAAIVAAVQAVWPRPTVEEDVTQTADAVWKFANRWWHGAGVLQRGRPRRPSAF